MPRARALLLQWLDERLSLPIVAEMAAYAKVSVRTLNRRFTEQMGISPVQWMIQARVDRAQCLLETTDLPIERVAAEVGFGSSVSLRQHFLHTVGTSPSAYRQAFRVTSGLCSYTGDTLES
ncbi:helix-turn-helix domain-containing protein [Pseudomonas mediterranea]|uniref:helix-turn-helix domain-containing protein n=1 Tax=Pseudomonas mediterranea TaxID=183795 RepID=UPI003BF49678